MQKNIYKKAALRKINEKNAIKTITFGGGHVTVLGCITSDVRTFVNGDGSRKNDKYISLLQSNLPSDENV